MNLQHPQDSPTAQLPTAKLPHARGGRKQKAWVEQTHDEYDAEVGRWQFTSDHYTGLVLEKVEQYLVKKDQGENVAAFRERRKLADYTNHLAVVIDAMSGMIFAVEDDANRRFSTDENEGLGDVADDDSPIAALQRDADGKGMGLPTIMKQLAVDLSQSLKPWILIDTDADRNPTVQLLPPSAVINWRHEGKRLVEAMVVDEVDVRTSLRDEVGTQKQYIHYEIGGWTRYTVSDKGVVVTGESGAYVYKNRKGEDELPIFRCTLPLRRPVGWLLAKKANVIFNKESERDHLLRSCNFPKLNLAANDDLYEELKKSLGEGANVLQSDPDGSPHSYISPDSAPATVATETLKRKVEEFFSCAFQMYGDAAQEKTATEVRQDVASGAGAFLQMLSAGLDDAENNVYWRVAQTLFPDDESRWWIARVERSRDFLPVDPELALTGRLARYFGKDVAVPVGRNALLSAARQAAEYDGLVVDEPQLEAAIDAWMLGQITDGAPAEIRVRRMLKQVAATGVIDPEAVIELSDGEKTTLMALIEKQAREVADAEDTAKKREAESFPGQPGAF